MDLKDTNQNVEKELRDFAIKYESFKEINESRITALENEILSSKENCQQSLEKTENEKKLFEEMLEKLKVEIIDLKEKQKDSEGIIQKTKALISKYENNHVNLKKEIAEKDGKIKSLEDACLAAKDLLKAKLEQHRMTLQALKDKITKKDTALMNDKEVLQKSVNEYKKKIEEMEEKTKSETQNIYWMDVYRENRKIDLSKLSCNAKKVYLSML
uniref:Uncharacterized protein n=1 Tax=Panagrolaimus davidi TaxID=227884 RepID=A0A914QZI2_9BILA